MAMPRHRTRMVQTPTKSFLSNYFPKDAMNYRAVVEAKAKDAGIVRCDGPVLVMAIANFELPKTYHRKRNPVGESWHTSKPDADNLSKMILDAMNHVA